MTTCKMTYRALGLSLAFTALVGAVIPARAETVQQSVTVAYGDLDLSSPAGLSTLHSRLVTANRRVCGEAGLDRAGQADMAACRANALRNAMGEMQRVEGLAHATHAEAVASGK